MKIKAVIKQAKVRDMNENRIDDLQGVNRLEKAVSDIWQLSRPCVGNKTKQSRTA